MWVFTKQGFISAVLHRNKANMIVRSRSRQHLVNVLKSAGLEGLVIHKTPRNDYPWRVFMTRHNFSWLMSKLVDEINYDNFKASIPAGNDEYEHSLHQVWSEMRDFQRREESVPSGDDAERRDPRGEWDAPGMQD